MKRLDANPLLTPKDVKPTRNDLEVLCTFNPGAVRVGKETVLLVRVAEKPIAVEGELATVYFDDTAGELRILRIKKDDPDLVSTDPRFFQYKGKAYLTSISHLRTARSTDGAHFAFDAAPGIVASTPNEQYGCEDPRITFIDGRYYVNYSVISDRGVATALTVTDDFRKFQKLGIIFTTYNKDIAIFPEKVRGKYVCRHRPDGSMFNKPSLWTAYSPDMLCWGYNELTVAGDPSNWEGGRIGCGAPPIKTKDGWLDIYHGSDPKGRYCLGAMLTDLDRPEKKLITRSRRPVLEPAAEYEMKGLYGNCVFSNGLVAEPDGTITIYYGAADSICAGVVTSVDEMIAAAKNI